jgi:hypothetical protein
MHTALAGLLHEKVSNLHTLLCRIKLQRGACMQHCLHTNQQWQALLSMHACF